MIIGFLRQYSFYPCSDFLLLLFGLFSFNEFQSLHYQNGNSFFPKSFYHWNKSLEMIIPNLHFLCFEPFSFREAQKIISIQHKKTFIRGRRVFRPGSAFNAAKGGELAASIPFREPRARSPGGGAWVQASFKGRKPTPRGMGGVVAGGWVPLFSGFLGSPPPCVCVSWTPLRAGGGGLKIST